MMTAIYAWTRTARNDPNAVTVMVSLAGDQVVADVVWPPNRRTPGGDYLYATNVPLALSRAEDVQDNYGFTRVVIFLADISVWDRDWGELVPVD